MPRASLPAFDTHENALAVIDTSGSMYYQGNPLPAAVALSLGLYFAEHNTGMFRNHFIEFSDQPQLIEIKENTFADRLRYAASFCKIASTNLEAVFDLILRAACRTAHHAVQHFRHGIQQLCLQCRCHKLRKRPGKVCRRRLPPAPGGVLECAKPRQTAARDHERTGCGIGQRLHAQTVPYAGQQDLLPLQLYAGDPWLEALRSYRRLILLPTA